jgi:hypothetical protein
MNFFTLLAVFGTIVGHTGPWTEEQCEAVATEARARMVQSYKQFEANGFVPKWTDGRPITLDDIEFACIEAEVAPGNGA